MNSYLSVVYFHMSLSKCGVCLEIAIELLLNFLLSLYLDTGFFAIDTRDLRSFNEGSSEEP